MQFDKRTKKNKWAHNEQSRREKKNEKPKKHIQASIITLIKLLKKIQREK
jgi:hypothetical protein